MAAGSSSGVIKFGAAFKHIITVFLDPKTIANIEKSMPM
jgi:hypothetical protein